MLQAPYGGPGYRPLGLRLKSSDTGKNLKVRSIVCYNLGSTVYFPKNSQYPTPDDEKISILNDNGPITLVKGIEDLEEVTDENSITLFSLTGDGSPYGMSQDLAGIKVNFFGEDVLPSDGGIPTTDIFQHVILIRNSEALTKMPKEN